MKCTLCGFEFDEKDGLKVCEGCLFAKGCKLIRCPNCSFEMPIEPGWVKKIIGWRKGYDKTKRK